MTALIGPSPANSGSNGAKVKQMTEIGVGTVVLVPPVIQRGGFYPSPPVTKRLQRMACDGLIGRLFSGQPMNEGPGFSLGLAFPRGTPRHLKRGISTTSIAGTTYLQNCTANTAIHRLVAGICPLSLPLRAISRGCLRLFRKTFVRCREARPG